MSGEAQQSWSGKMSIVDLNPHQQGLVVWLISLGLDVTGTELVEDKDGGCEIVRLPKAAHVQDSEHVNFLGIVWCSWFCTLQDGLASLSGNKDVNLFGSWSTGVAGPTLVGDHNITEGHWMAIINH